MFDTNERNMRVDNELEALKQRMGLSSTGGSTSGSGGSSGGSWGNAGESPSSGDGGDGGPDTKRIGMAQGGQ